MKLLRARQRQSDQPRSGAALVEMALVLPIFILVTMGIVEFGRAMMVGQLVTNAAREGARFAVVDGSSNSQVVSQISTFMQQAVNVAPNDVAISITVEPAPGNPNPGNEVGNAGPRDLVTIRIEVPFDKVSFTKGKYLNGKMLVGQAAMRHE